jgi:phosphotriesterase-related protein
VAGRGAFVEYDHLGRDSFVQEWGCGHNWGRDSWRARFAKRLLDEGRGERLPFSQDCCIEIELRGHGGPGYAHVLENSSRTPGMGALADDVPKILVGNQARGSRVEP